MDKQNPEIGFSRIIEQNSQISNNEAEKQTSKMNVCLGETLRTSSAFKYGSGCGLALSHSSPTTRTSKNLSSPISEIINSALILVEFVTTALFRPWLSTHLHSFWRPSIGSKCSVASLHIPVVTILRVTITTPKHWMQCSLGVLILYCKTKLSNNNTWKIYNWGN